MTRSVVVLAIAILACLPTRALAAQGQPPSHVRVRVVDTSGAAISGVGVDLVQGIDAKVASSVSDSAGIATFSGAFEGQLQVIARKVGYRRSSLFLVASGQALSVSITLTQSVPVLPGMAVTASVDARRRSYHLDADEIAASTRNLQDALDLVAKLKSDMVHPKQGYAGFVSCDPKYIWVNGQEIRQAPVNDRLALEFRHRRAVAAALPKTFGKHPYGVEWLPADIVNVLSSIKPEHIEEINYSDCFQPLTDAPHGINAFFVVLKQGVSFAPGLGSLVHQQEP